MSLYSALAARRIFILYKLVPLPSGKTDKIPIDPATGRNSSAQDESTWMLPAIALGWAAACGAGFGVGIAFREPNGIFCIDVDGCTNPDGSLSDIARQLVSEYSGCYIEWSQSGRGLHIFASYVGDAPAHECKNSALHIELYHEKRFIALTGNLLAPEHCDVLRDMTMQLWVTAGTHFQPSAKGRSEELTDAPVWPVMGLENVKRHKPRFARMLAGERFTDDASDHDLEFVCYALEAHGGDGQATLAYLQTEHGYEFSEKKSGRMDWYLPRTICKAFDRLNADPAVNVKFGGDLPAGFVALMTPEKPAEPAVDTIAYVGGSYMPELFLGYVYIQDEHKITGPDGYIMDSKRFDADPRFAKRAYQMKRDGSAPGKSAWEAFIQSEVSTAVKVRGAFFDPREEPGVILLRDGASHVNTWKPVDIDMEPGDVTPWLKHISTLFDDWRLLDNYCKFMVQHKGEKVMWWPFLQGVPGNGKSFINNTMEYCIGQKFTVRPKAATLDSNFNAELYGKLFLGIDDIKVADDYAAMWEAIKPMVTDSRLQIEPKGVDKITREVCFNAILNSNHKDGIRKTIDDRRIAPMFAKQQRRGDLARDGLTKDYFKALHAWAKEGRGWAHVAYYLHHDPIDADFDPTDCPWTTSTPEAIRVGRSPAQQEILDKIAQQNYPGLKGGWVNMTVVSHILDARRYRLSGATREAMIEELGYVPHPGLIDGRMPCALGDGSQPVLYVLPDHSSVGQTDPAMIKTLYETANR